jgi:MFS family permease
MRDIPKITIFTLLLLSMTTMMSNVAIVTTLPHLKEHFMDEANIEFYSRMMITFPSLAIALLAPFLGHLIHHFGKKNTTIVALSFFALFGSAGLYLNSIETLLASRFLLGITIATLMIVTTSLVGEYFQEQERHRFMGLQSAFVAFGGVFFVLGGGMLADIHWRYSFGIYLIGVLLVPMSWLYLKEYQCALIEESEALKVRLFGIYFLAFLLMLIFYVLPTQIPFLIINHFGASSTLTGAIIATAFVSNALGAIAFARLKKRFSFAQIYLIGMAILAFGFACIGFVDNVYLFFLTSPIMGFGGGVAMTNVVAWMLSRVGHKKRVKSSGYLTSALFLGQFSSPLFFHPFVSYFGVQHFFLFIACVIAFGVALFYVSKRDSLA